MKKIFATIILAIVTITFTACEKSNVAKYIAESKGYVSTKIIDLGELQDFPYITMKAQSLNLLIAMENSYIAEETLKAFSEAKTIKEAIKILTTCLDSTQRFENEIIPSTTTQMHMAMISDTPEFYLGNTVEDIPTMKARKVSYSTPDGYVKTDVVIYKEDGDIQGLASTGAESVKNFLQSLHIYNQSVNTLQHDIRDWQRGYYRP